MRRHLRLLLTLVLILVASPLLTVDVAHAAAPVYQDNFNGNHLNTNKWVTGSEGSGSTIAQTNGELEVSFAADANQAPDNAGDFGPWITTACALQGDFDIQVDYRLLVWPPQNGIWVELMALPPGPTYVTEVDRVSYQYAPYEAYYNNTATDNTNVPTADQSGSLRLARSGDTGTGFYRSPGGDWTPILSGPMLEGTGDITPTLRITASAAPNYFGGKPVLAAFDNFQVNAGRFAC